MDQHATSSTSARSPTPITEEADEDDDSSSAYGRTIRRIMQKTLTDQELRLNIPAAQLSKQQMVSQNVGQLISDQFDAQSTVSASEVDNSSPKYSIIMQPDCYESRSLYSISEYEVEPGCHSSAAYNRLFELQNAYHRMLHNQFECSFTNSLLSENELQASSDGPSLVASTDEGQQHVLAKAPRPEEPGQPQSAVGPGSPLWNRNMASLLRGRLARARSLPRWSSGGGGAANTRPTADLGSARPAKSATRLASSGPARHALGGSEQEFCATSNQHSMPRQSTCAPSEEAATESAEEENDLHTKWSWRNLRREFKLSHSESLFHLYHAKLQQSFFVALLILNIIFNLGAVISYAISKYHGMNIYLIIMRLASVLVMISFLILIWCNKVWMQSKFSRTVAALAVLMGMIFGEASGAICALMNDQATPLASIRRTYYLIITNHVFLPFPSRIQACAATIIITSFEIVVTYISRRDNNCRADYLTKYSIADIIFYASSAMIGFQITFLLEIAIRRTFLNHKYCIQSTYKLNYEKEQQEQLLRSCFPQHLIEQVRNDIRQSIAIISKRQSQPFRPFYNLYVKKYENVTILYADIVNSMNLTDKLTPAELVETLNELYGRFDELAEKYNCLRIKLLGDCYYCVSGLPEFDHDHAIKCLLMGLGMIEIIESIKQSRNVDIGMRIGIHSGSVLSGLLGLRKWQFDIWSFDAMKASAMEHNGQPGFVHITQRTLDLISKDDERLKNVIITTHRHDDGSESYMISEPPKVDERNEPARANRRNGQSEKLKAYIEKLRLRPAAGAMDFTQRRIALESSLKKYREIHEKVDETMKTAIAEMPLGR